MEKILYLLVAVALLIAAVYLGLPRLLHAIGLHPDYDIPPYDLKGKRALVITTSHDTLGDTGKATGVFGSEMTIPYYAFLDAGMDVDLASIQGGAIPVDPRSGWPLSAPEDKRFNDDAAAIKKLNNSLAIADIDANDYDVLFMAGGWGAAYDLAQSDELADVITQANASGKILGSVCHGALGLVSAEATNGEPLIKGRIVTGVTDRQIRQLRVTVTPKHPETEMRKVGALFEAKTARIEMLATHVVVDGNIVTGQNQNSGYEAAHRVLELLENATAQ
jgi:putative intracellular protease/amidase